MSDQELERTIKRRVMQADLEHLRKLRTQASVKVDEARKHFDYICQKISDIQDRLILEMEAPTS